MAAIDVCGLVIYLSPSFLPNTHDPVSACLSISSVSIQCVGSCTGELVPNLLCPLVMGRASAMDGMKGNEERTREFQPQFFSARAARKEIYLKGETSHYPPANERAENTKHCFLPLLQQREIIVAFCVVQSLPS